MIFLQTPPTLLPDSIPSRRQELDMLSSLPIDELINRVVSKLVTFTINLAIAIVVFYVGKFIIKKINNLLASILVRRNVDKSLSTFILSLVKMVLFFILIVTVIGILGIETSSFIAIFASAGVAIGMALSGTLQNFAGGVLILLLKPYKVGDYIEAQGFAGYVTEVQIFHTIINTYDNKSIIIPNGGLSTGSINNWSREEYRRVEWSVSISYGDDVDAARNAILAILANDSRVVKEFIEDDREERRKIEEAAAAEAAAADCPEGDCEEEEQHSSWISRLFRHQKRVKAIGTKIASVDEKKVPVRERVSRKPSVTVNLLNESSVDLKARAWTRNDFYWSLFYDINEKIYKQLPEAGIHFPFPQLDVHMKNEK